MCYHLKYIGIRIGEKRKAFDLMIKLSCHYITHASVTTLLFMKKIILYSRSFR